MQLSNGEWKASFIHLFPLLQYHSRWKELNSNDFRLPFVRRDCETRGHLASQISQAVRPPVKTLEGVDENMPQENERCLVEMLRLCQENGSCLILFKAPSVEWHTPNLALETFAKEHSIQYWDFNTNLNEIGLDFSNDFVDSMHINAKGARVFTAFLAKRLKHLSSECHI